VLRPSNVGVLIQRNRRTAAWILGELMTSPCFGCISVKRWWNAVSHENNAPSVPVPAATAIGLASGCFDVHGLVVDGVRCGAIGDREALAPPGSCDNSGGERSLAVSARVGCEALAGGNGEISGYNGSRNRC
jgi:hypothetical protein